MHGGLVSRLTRLLVERLGRAGIVSPQNPVVLSDVTEPQPDLSVLRWRADDYTAENPRAGDALLVIEVADSSLRFDRDVKLGFYTQAGVPEVWIVDVRARRLLVFRAPSGRAYAEARVLGPGDTAFCGSLPALQVGLDELFAGV